MRLRMIVLFLSLVGLVGCDHATKHWAEHELSGRAPIALYDRVLELRYTQNDDVAFSLLREVPLEVRTPLILVSATVASAALVLLLWRRRQKLELAALTLMLGGAVGNLADRFARGYVVDFIHLRHWPVFNLADVWITAGAVLLFAATFLGGSTRGWFRVFRDRRQRSIMP